MSRASRRRRYRRRKAARRARPIVDVHIGPEFGSIVVTGHLPRRDRLALANWMADLYGVPRVEAVP